MQTEECSPGVVMLRLTVRPDVHRPVRVTLSTMTVEGISLIASGLTLQGEHECGNNFNVDECLADLSDLVCT